MPPGESPPHPPTPAERQAAASTSRLPDFDILGSLTDVKPGTIPLLVRMPDGAHEQLDVPLDSTFDDIAASLQRGSSDSFRLSFANTDLDPSATLLDTNIVDAYEHAGSLLHLIATGGRDVHTKAAALDSACAVVENISNGTKDMSALCAAAMAQEHDPDHVPNLHSSPPTAPSDQNSSTASQQDPTEIHRNDAKGYNTTSNATTPSQLAYTLSRRLPNLFQPRDADQPSLGRRLTAQPTISSIRDARRRASALRRAQLGNGTEPPAREASDSDLAIGESTNGPFSLELNDPATDAAAVLHTPREGSSLLLANSGKSTWLEDVMKTWEIDAVRESGVLEKSKDGQELSNYLQGLKEEAEREIEISRVENSEDASASSPHGSGPGDSSDEEDGDEEHDEGDTNRESTSQSDAALSAQSVPLGVNPDDSEGSANGLRQSMAAVAITSPSHSSDSATQMFLAQKAASAAVFGNTHQHENSNQHIASSINTQHQETNTINQVIPNGTQRHMPSSEKPSLLLPQQKQDGQYCPLQSKNLVHSQVRVDRVLQVPPIVQAAERNFASAANGKSNGTLRQATKIAPAPDVPESSLVGTNGPFCNTLFPGVAPVPGVAWPTPPAVPRPKKRGRKRKNPELTEEERALVRKEKNRESAKLSRVRRKVIAAEYEGRLNVLVEENTMLRKQVEGLNNRLVYLQSLLTVSVRQEPSQS